MKEWFIAYTQPCKEYVARRHLQEQGFDVYLPQFKKMRRHARKVEEVLSPLFPRYVFVGMNLEASPWRSVGGTRGVSYLLMNENHPATVPERIVEGLKEQENAEGAIPTSILSLFVKGDKVRILTGAFQDQTAVFETLDDKQRVHLLLTFLGREMRVSVPKYGVEAA